MTTPNLIELFDELRKGQSSMLDRRTFSALPIPGITAHHLGIDSDGAPCILFSTRSENAKDIPLPIVLEGISVHHNVPCKILSLNSSDEEGSFSIMRCTSHDSTLQHYFLKVASAIVASFNRRPKHSEISNAIRKLVELFSLLAEPARKAVSGLWGELFVIAQSSNPCELISGWHANPDDIHDFSSEGQRIEVKTAGNRIRRHHFNLAQLIAPSNCKITVVSIFIESDSSGISLEDLIEKIRSRLRKYPSLVIHLDRVVIQTLGSGLRTAMSQSFDYQLAKESILFFRSDKVPSVSRALPMGVSDVHFKSELNADLREDGNVLKREGGLFRAMISK
jgi:hypothetical protein